MPVGRRLEILRWAKEKAERYISEDDYDSEFRFQGKPLPTMESMDHDQKIIYVNTFSKTISPSFRISYMILPPALMERYHQNLGFYSCTVPVFDQIVLAEFIRGGDLERYINRRRRRLRQQMQKAGG